MPVPRKNSTCFPIGETQTAVRDWPDRSCLEDVPQAIAKVESWPTWRRLLLLPDTSAFERIDGWRGLVQAAALIDTHAEKLPFDRCQNGIFWRSRPCWNQFTKCAWNKREFEGLVAGGRKTVLRNPFGPLVLESRMDEFACDILDVEGIAGSNSSDIFFDSVASFGQRYCSFVRAEMNEHGLQQMLHHRDVGITDPAGNDSLDLWFWDGRLFLCSEAGSRRFAAAAFIAEVIEQPVPLKAPLTMRWLNAPAWNWLLSRYCLLHVPAHARFTPKQCLATLLGQVFTLRLGSRPLSEENLFLIPKNAAAFSPVVKLLEGRGLTDINREIYGLLRRQEANRRKLSRRWPSICVPPWLEKGTAEKLVAVKGR